LVDTGLTVESVDPRDKRAMELLHKRVKDRAVSLRWNLNGLMFIYAVLIIVVILAIQNINGMFVALVAVIGLISIWLFSTLQVRKLEEQFYQQEIRDYADLLSNRTLADDDPRTVIPGDSPQSPLTQRELEIIKLMSWGKRNKEMAYALGISEGTVKNHISHIFNKLEIYDRVAVVLLAIRSGWIEYDASKKPVAEDSIS